MRGLSEGPTPRAMTSSQVHNGDAGASGADAASPFTQARKGGPDDNGKVSSPEAAAPATDASSSSHRRQQEGGGQQGESAAVELRRVFSHLESPCTISAWLTEPQKAAVKRYHKEHNMRPQPAQGEPWTLADFPANTTPEEVQLIEALKARLKEEGSLKTEHDRAYVNDLRCLQYLRARDHDLDKSFQMLQHSLAWREKHRPWEAENAASRTDKTVSDARVVGFDPEGRVVIYSSFSNTTKRDPEYVQVNIICTLEKAALVMQAGAPGGVVWVNHFCARHKNGFGWRDCNPAFFWSGIEIFSDNYPECLTQMMIVEPPSIFHPLWRVIQPLIPEKTRSKGAIIDVRGGGVKGRAKTKEMFLSRFGEELGEWIWAQIEKDS